MLDFKRPPEVSYNILEFGSFGVLRQACTPTPAAEIHLATEEDMHYYHVIKSIHAEQME